MIVYCIMIERLFHLHDNGTNVRTELLSGSVTFFTMAYIIFLQPAILSGLLFGIDTGMDAGAVMTVTILISAMTTIAMGLYANLPIGLAPGMGQNFFFTLTVIPAAMTAGFPVPWQTAMGTVFIAGVIFVILSLTGARRIVMRAVSPGIRTSIAAGIGLFIALLGLKNSGLIINDSATGMSLAATVFSPDIFIFAASLFLSVALHARKIPGSIFISIIFAVFLALFLRWVIPLFIDPSTSVLLKESQLFSRFKEATSILSIPPSPLPTFGKLDLRGAISLSMIPFVLIFLFMDMFDTTGTLLAIGKHARINDNTGMIRNVDRAFLCDAGGTVAGAFCGTSTVTAYIESVAGVEQGGRTGLTAVITGALFLTALFFGPLVEMIGSYPPATAAALVIVGSLMMRSILDIKWDDITEALPAFLTITGIPFTFSISDGIAIGLASYPIVKWITGKRKDVNMPVNILGILVILYLIFLRPVAG